MAVCAGSLALAENAAAVGDIGWDGCLANDSSQGCGDLPSAPLSGPRGVAVSPDGRSVYVTSSESDSISHLFRSGPQGQIAWDGCLANDSSQGCGDVSAAPLDLPNRVAVSPDGGSVYVASSGSDSISHLFRSGPQGQIAWDGCLANDSSQGCGDLPAAPLSGAFGVAVSPDGKSVYVASFESDSISHLFRSGPQGQIAWDGCLANDSSQGCGDLPSAPLDFAANVAVSPDGTSVYVASREAGTPRSRGSISHLFRSGPQGQIVWDGCLEIDGLFGCADVPAAPFRGPSDIAVSPDGKSVYVASAESDSISHFFRSGPEGQIAWGGCLANDGSEGCGDLPAAPLLDGALGVAVSPDGNSVYVTSSSGSISHFPRGPGGQISWGGCLANDDSQACGDIPAAPLAGAASVAVSPDGKSVYVASGQSDSIAHFFRAVGDEPPLGSVVTNPPADPPSTDDPPGSGERATCQGRRATIVGTARPDRLRGTRRPDVIAAGSGNDRVQSRGASDLVCGGKGNDRLSGGAGADLLAGQGGRDRLNGDAGPDRLIGGAKRDRCAGGRGLDRASGCERRRSV